MANDHLVPVTLDSATRRQSIRKKAIEGLSTVFPLKTKNFLLEMANPRVKEQDYSSREQKQALLEGRTLNERVLADVTVRNNAGEIVDEVKGFTLVHLPYFTPRHTFILGGNEYNVSNQIRTKPGVYTRRRGNEDLEAAFNLSKGSNFRISMDPAKGLLHMQYGTTNIPLYPVLQSLGMPHQDIAKAWGAEVAETNRAAYKAPDKHIAKLYDRLIFPTMQTAKSHDEKVTAIREYFEKTQMDPEVNQRTLGHAYDKVSPDVMLVASKKLLDVHRAAEDTDDRDSLEFKTFHQVDDLIKERISLDARMLKMKIGLKLDGSKGKLRDAIPSAPFSLALNRFLTNSKLSAVPMQINPMELIDQSAKVTSLGEGGIASDRAIPLEARALHASHLGIFDPIRTPESGHAGIDIRTALWARRDDKGNLYAPVTNIKTGEQEFLRPGQMLDKVVAFPGEHVAPGKMVDAMKGGQVVSVSASQVTHQIPHGAAMYGPTTNLLPLLHGMQGNRAIMASKHQSQALSLVHREAPLVQVKSWHGDTSVEEEMARLVVPTAPIGGRISKIDGDYIYISPHHDKVSSETLYHGSPHKLDELRAGSWVTPHREDALTFGIPWGSDDLVNHGDANGRPPRELEFKPGRKPKDQAVYVYEVTGPTKPATTNTGKSYDWNRQTTGPLPAKLIAEHSSWETALAQRQRKTASFVFDPMEEELYSDFMKIAADGDLRLHYDSHFPLAAKSFLHNTLTVKEGDEVHPGQMLADSNFTKDNTLALGTNLKVGYMAYRGLNTNDGIVISQGAADKLVSEHMYKYIMQLDSELTASRDKHQTYFGVKYSGAQYKNLDDDGAIKPGTIVKPGDPLIVALRKNALTGDAAILGKLSKSLLKPYREEVETWDHESPGEVIDVVKMPTRITVTIKTREHMNVGDKLCFDEATEVLTRAGWKPVAAITLDDEVCTLDDGRIQYTPPTELHRYEQGGRMYYIRSQQVDLVVTEKHRMYVKERGSDDFELLPAHELFGRRVRYCKRGEWTGQPGSHVTFPAMTVRAGQSGNGEREISATTLPLNTYLMVLGAYLSDGNIIDQPASGSYGIDITKKKEPHTSQLKAALDATGVHYNYNPGNNKFRIYSKQWMEHFKQFGHAKAKFIPPAVFEYARDNLQVLFDWLMWGDGTVVDGLPICFTTTSRQLADDVQRLCLHIGKAANVQIAAEAGIRLVVGEMHMCQRTYSVRIINTKLEPMVNHGHVRTQGGQEEGFIESYEKPVFCVNVPSHVLYVRRNGKAVWSGNSGRYGNKGVIAKILPDHQMIQDESGKPIDLLFTSAGIISRVNPAQVIESALGKVAAKTGKPILVDNFAHHDNVQYAKDLLAKHGLKDKEVVYDPITQKSIPGVFVGNSYILKIFKTTDSNWATHGAERYDVNQQPSRGGDEGAKAIGKMEFDGLVAHNARNVLREAASLKSQKNDEFWRAVQLGTPTPTPTTTFAYNKFLNLLQAGGIKVSKEGSRLSLGPMTDSDIRKMSSGAIPDGNKRIRAKDLQPEIGGLFDPAITGGMSGTKWSHVDLHEPVVNPVFEEPVRRLLGLTQKQFDDLHAKHGGSYFQRELGKIKVDDKIDDLKERSRALSGTKLDDAVKQIKYLTALGAAGLKPDKAYVLSVVPVAPPIIRPILPLPDGTLMTADANDLYKDAFLANKKLGELKSILPDAELQPLRAHLYQAVGAVFGTHDPVSPKLAKRGAKGFLNLITGTRPGNGFFQSKIMKRQQDVSGRATIAPDPTLSMDEIGVPEDMLWGMYGKFVIARLVQKGYGALEAQKMVDDKAYQARQELMMEAKERPVLVNRAPSLHRFSIIGAYPKLIDGKTIKLNPFAEKGMNADYDGDAMQIHAPVTAAGVADVKKMTLSNLIFTDRKANSLNVAPDHEAIIGLHRASQAESGKATKNYASHEDALHAYHAGALKLSDPVKIGR